MKRSFLPSIFGADSSALEVPARVRDTIARQQDASERLDCMGPVRCGGYFRHVVCHFAENL